jgi:hypothetical protein
VGSSIVVLAAVVFAVLMGGVIIFQFALALGAPWGQSAMGGRFPARFPPAMRAAAVVQACVLALLAFAVLSDARLVAPDTGRAAPWLIWLPVAVSILALILNVITPSARERRVWAPVAAVLLLTSLVVALSP